MSTDKEKREPEGENKKILLRNLKLFINKEKKNIKDNKMELLLLVVDGGSGWK